MQADSASAITCATAVRLSRSPSPTLKNAPLPLLRRTLHEDNPTFELYDQNQAASDRNYFEQSGRAALEELKALRAETAAGLVDVPLEMWSRVGTHPDRGPLTVEEQVTRQIKNHDLSHLVQIKDILRIKMPW